MSDRVFTVSFAVSLSLHLVLLIGQLLQIDWLTVARRRTPIEVIYEYEIAKREERALAEQLARAKRESDITPSRTELSARTEIRIPDRPTLASERELPDLVPGLSSVVDLTNLVDASRGDPVLLSYFSAIREQIQQTANHRSWLADEESQGLVYVAFVLSATGSAHDVQVVSNRSVSSTLLQDIALRIVKASPPFPPFPPSMRDEAQKTIVVPLEFSSGGG